MYILGMLERIHWEIGRKCYLYVVFLILKNFWGSLYIFIIYIINIVKYITYKYAFIRSIHHKFNFFNHRGTQCKKIMEIIVFNKERPITDKSLIFLLQYLWGVFKGVTRLSLEAERLQNPDNIFRETIGLSWHSLSSFENNLGCFQPNCITYYNWTF